MATGPVPGQAHLAAAQVQLVVDVPGEESPVEADVLAREPAVERLVRRDRVAGTRCQREADSQVVAQVGIHAHAGTNTMPVALRRGRVVVDRLVPITEVAGKLQSILLFS